MGVGDQEPVVVQAGERRSARLEGVRALAAMGVLIGHVWGTYHSYTRDAYDGIHDRILIGGGVGVFLFFALTGYLLFWPFVRRDLLGGDGVDLRTYARNRILRIVPLYLISTAIVLIWIADGGSLRQWLLFMTFSENFAMDTIGQVNGALWSVVVEIHYYILLPVLALVLRLVSRGRMLVTAGVLLALGGVSLVLWLEKTPDSPLWRYNLPTTFFFFIGGMLLAVFRGAIQRGSIRIPRLVGHSDLWVLAAVPCVGYCMDQVRPEPMALAGFFLVGACVLPLRHGIAMRIIGSRPFAFIGVISYSIYLWQGPFLEKVPLVFGDASNHWTGLALTIPVVILVSWLSFRYIETPFLRLRRRWAAGAAPQEPGPSDALEVREPGDAPPAPAPAVAG